MDSDSISFFLQQSYLYILNHRQSEKVLYKKRNVILKVVETCYTIKKKRLNYNNFCQLVSLCRKPRLNQNRYVYVAATNVNVMYGGLQSCFGSGVNCLSY